MNAQRNRKSGARLGNSPVHTATLANDAGTVSLDLAKMRWTIREHWVLVIEKQERKRFLPV
jgi:hypothetical protein